LRPPWQYVSPDTPSRHNQPVLPLLSAHGLSQSFGPDDVFSGVSLSIPEGGKIGLVGPNGIGKTTLLRKLKLFTRRWRSLLRHLPGTRSTQTRNGDWG